MKYVYLVQDMNYGMVSICPDEATANAVVKDLATAYGHKVKDPNLDYRFLDDEAGGFPEVYWKRWKVAKSIL